MTLNKGLVPSELRHDAASSGSVAVETEPEPAPGASAVIVGDPVARESEPISNRAFWVVTAATVLALAASGTPSPLYVDYQARWHFSATTLTTIYAIYAAGVILTLVLMGGLSDRVGRKPVMFASVAVLIASLLIFAFAQNIGWLYAARAIQGLATGVFTAAAGAALSELHHRRDHRFASLVNSTSTSTGIAFGAVLSGALAQWVVYPLVVPYANLAILSSVVLVAIALWVPETVETSGSWFHHVFRPQRLSIPSSIRREFAIGSLCVLAAWSVGGLYLALGGTLAKELLHVNNHLVAGLVILAVQGVGGVSQMLWNIALPKATIHSATIAGCSALILGMGVVASSLAAGSAVLFFIGSVATGIGFGLAFMAGTRRVTHVAPDNKRGEVMAAYFVVAYLAISVPVIVAGLVSTRLGVTHTFYLFAAVMSLVSFLTMCATAVVDKRAIRTA